LRQEAVSPVVEEEEEEAVLEKKEVVSHRQKVTINQ
jgi:hypothetical protein